MATMMETQKMTTHEFHAQAHVLRGTLERPIEQKIEEHAPVTFNGRRATHLTRAIEDVNIEGLISLKRGHTRVSGSRSKKHEGWTTLSTSIMEGLNAFEVITADRLVSQISTDHPLKDGHFPKVTVLGTQFNNLRVSGFPVTLTLDFGFFGETHDGDISYLDTPEFLRTVTAQVEKIAAADLPEEMKKDYSGRRDTLNALLGRCGARQNGEIKPSVKCSIVKSIGEIPIPGVRSVGNVLIIPEFGTVTLGEIEVGERIYNGADRPDNYFELTSIQMNLGCIGQGTVSGGTVAANGHHSP